MPTGCTGFELSEGTDRIEAGFAPDGEFGQHNGQPDQGDANQINQDECATAVLPGDVGKLPDIAEADGGTGSGQNETHPGGPEPSFVVRFSHGELV